MDFSTIGEKLKYLRLNNSLTQEEVGKKINVSKQTLYKYENGIITNIPSDKIEILAEIYHVSPAYLMGWENTSSVPNLVEIIRNDSYTLAGRTPTSADRAYLSDMVDTYIDESSDQTIAAHRTDSPSADLPDEALQSIEEFKNFVRAKYKKD